jgi:hypothetical protein
LHVFDFEAALNQSHGVSEYESEYALAVSALSYGRDLDHWVSELNAHVSTSMNTTFASSSKSKPPSTPHHNRYDSSDDENDLYSLPEPLNRNNSLDRDIPPTRAVKRPSPSTSSGRSGKRHRSSSSDKKPSAEPTTATKVGNSTFLPAESAADKLLRLKSLKLGTKSPGSDFWDGDL